MSTGWMMEVAIMPAAPPLTKGRAALNAGWLRTSVLLRAAEREGAVADIVAVGNQRGSLVAGDKLRSREERGGERGPGSVQAAETISYCVEEGFVSNSRNKEQALVHEYPLFPKSCSVLLDVARWCQNGRWGSKCRVFRGYVCGVQRRGEDGVVRVVEVDQTRRVQ